jgi:hypothetical protein
MHAHKLELYNSKTSVAACTFYNILPNSIKQVTGNRNQAKKELMYLLLKNAIIQ